MILHIFARLEPKPGMRDQVLEEMALVFEPTRAEPGCLKLQQFESIAEPSIFYIYSEWVDEQAFEAHIDLPHTQRFVEAMDRLLVQPLRAVRSRQIR